MAGSLPDIPTSASDVEVLTKLAVDRYDFDSVRSDIADIIDIPSAIARIGAWTAGLPVGLGVLTWLVFRSRMGGGALFLFLIAVVLLAAIAGVAIGVAVVTRRRVDKTSAAAARIVEITGMVHGDYEQVREGAAKVSVRSVGVLAAREIVLPALFGVAGRAAFLGGPLGWLMRPVLGVVESKVTKALGELPDTPRALPAAQPTQRELSDATTEVVTPDEIIDPPAAGVSAAYADIQARFEQIVGRLGGVATRSSKLIAGLASLPVIIVLLLGWLLT